MNSNNTLICHGPAFDIAVHPSPCKEVPTYTAYDAWGNPIPMCLKHYRVYVDWLKTTMIRTTLPAMPAPMPINIPVDPLEPLPKMPYTPGPSPLIPPYTPPVTPARPWSGLPITVSMSAN